MWEIVKIVKRKELWKPSAYTHSMLLISKMKLAATKNASKLSMSEKCFNYPEMLSQIIYLFFETVKSKWKKKN